MQLIFITVPGRHLFKKTTFTVSTLPRAWLEPRANRMLVMKVLRQDVAILAFHPHDALRGLKTHGTSLSFVTPKTVSYTRKGFRWDEQCAVSVPGVAALRSNQRCSAPNYE